MNICGIQIDPAAQAAIFGFALTVASELIGASSLKENSIAQLGLTLARRFMPPSGHTPVAPPRKSSPAPRQTSRRRTSKSTSQTESKKA